MLLPKDIEQELDMVQTTFTAQVILKHRFKSFWNEEIVKYIWRAVSKHTEKEG